MYNEIDQCEGWYENMKQIADGGILIVDMFSTDGSYEFFKDKQDVVIIQSSIIVDEGYGPARNHLRDESRKHFPESHWMMYLDADERLLPEDFHKLRWIKDNLIDDYDVVGLPRIDWLDKEMTKAAKDWRVQPDWQARMSRLNSGVRYVRRLHEQVADYKQIYTKLNSPKIHHFHRSAGAEKRDFVGRLCSKLHAEDSVWGGTYPQHPKEAMYYEEYKKYGLEGPKE